MHACILLGMVTCGDMTKMAVTPFDPSYLKTACYTQTQDGTRWDFFT